MTNNHQSLVAWRITQYLGGYGRAAVTDIHKWLCQAARLSLPRQNSSYWDEALDTDRKRGELNTHQILKDKKDIIQLDLILSSFYKLCITSGHRRHSVRVPSWHQCRLHQSWGYSAVLWCSCPEGPTRFQPRKPACPRPAGGGFLVACSHSQTNAWLMVKDCVSWFYM